MPSRSFQDFQIHALAHDQVLTAAELLAGDDLDVPDVLFGHHGWALILEHQFNAALQRCISALVPADVFDPETGLLRERTHAP